MELDRLAIGGRVPVLVEFDRPYDGGEEWVTPYTRTMNVDANCVTSMCRLDENYHLPVFDVDVDLDSMVALPFGEPLNARDSILAHFPTVTFVPSSTEGHHHAYAETPMLWETYLDKLQNLTWMGVIEPGYLNASITRKCTICRKPGVKKETSDGVQPANSVGAQ